MTGSDTTRDELFRSIERAFDYRGDVTVNLRDGQVVVGYLFDRRLEAESGHVDVLPKESDQKRRIDIADITDIDVTGRDMASGRSWEEWVRRHEEREVARREGRDLPDIEPAPPEL